MIFYSMKNSPSMYDNHEFLTAIYHKYLWCIEQKLFWEEYFMIEIEKHLLITGNKIERCASQ